MINGEKDLKNASFWVINQLPLGKKRRGGGDDLNAQYKPLT